MDRLKFRITKNQSTLKTERRENEKKKDKSKSKNWLPKFFRLGSKSAKKKDIDMKKGKEKNQDKDEVQFIGKPPLTTQAGKKSRDRDEVELFERRPLTTKSVGKFESKSQVHDKDKVQFIGKRPLPTQSVVNVEKKLRDRDELELLGRRPLTTKSVEKFENKSQDRDEVELFERRPLTTKSDVKFENKTQVHDLHVDEVEYLDRRSLTTKSEAKGEPKSQHMSPPTIPSTIVRQNIKNKSESDNTQKIKAVEHRTTSSIPNGLPNLGNTCYFNATLQCLFWCKGFSSLMNNKPMGKVSDRLMEVFRYLDGDIEQENNRPKSVLCGLRRNTNTGREGLKRLLDALRQSNDQFNGYDQQDSFEMLNTILSSIQEEYKGKNIRTSFVEEEFGGTFVTTYVHDQCQEVDLVFQNFTTISIPVPETKTTLIHPFSAAVQKTNKGSTIIQVGNSNVKDALCLSTSRSGNTGIIRGLREVTSVETMAADILPCRKCNDNAFGSILKRSTIIAIPKILILHIGRFSQSGRSLYKNQRLVSYPYILNISDVCSSAVEVFGIDSTSMQYELCGVVCHSGTMDSGHYVAYVNTSPYAGQPTVKCNLKDNSKIIEENLSRKIRNSSSDHGYSHDTDSNNNTNHTWYKISDSHVQSVHSSLNLQDAYILFYRLHH